MELTRLAERFSEGIGGAAALAFIAFSVVFMVLVGLTLIIFAVRFLAAGGGKTAGRGGPAKPKPEPPKVAPGKSPASESGADGALVAAIAAAVAASGGGVVTAVRKVTPIGRAIGRGKSWKLAGRADLMEGMD